MIFWECCSSYCKGTTVKYSRYGRTGPDRPPQPTTQRILPQLGRGWRVGEPRKCYARAWTGGRDTSFYLVTVHHGQKMQFFVKELTVDHCRAPNDRSGLLRRPPRPVRTPCEPSFPSDLRIFRTEIQPLLSGGRLAAAVGHQGGGEIGSFLLVSIIKCIKETVKWAQAVSDHTSY